MKNPTRVRLVDGLDGEVVVRVSRPFPTSEGKVVRAVVNASDNSFTIKDSNNDVLTTGSGVSTPMLLKNLKSALSSLGVSFEPEVRKKL